jgi:glucose/arabinose dehydrogenase
MDCPRPLGRSALLLLWVALATGLGANIARSAAAQDFAVRRVASGLSLPVFVTAPPGDADRVFIVEQRSGGVGRIRILQLAGETLLPDPFLEVVSVASGFEQGLLGLAFHPDYASNGRFFVDYTDAGGTTRVVRCQVSADPDVADPTSCVLVLSIPQPQQNHNGGWIGFGPDGLLYVASGDGGGSDDNDAGHTPGTGNARDLTGNLLGKLLRIDVDGDDFPLDPARNYAIPPDNPFVGSAPLDEIWAWGLRNPWRPSFDRDTGDLYIADVGQATREEIDVQPARSPGGTDYGWRLREGTIATPTGGVGGARPPGAVDPIYEYSHGSGPSQGFSVTGGYVYRGPALSLRGHYFFADFSNDRVWSLRWDGSPPATHDGTNFDSFTDWTDDPAFQPDVGILADISSFGEDAAGNLYITAWGGDVFRIEALPLSAPALGGTGLAWLATLLLAAGTAVLRTRGPARRPPRRLR